MTTILDLPFEIHCQFLDYVARPYWAFYGQANSFLQPVIIYLKQKSHLAHQVSGWETFIKDNDIKMVQYLCSNKYKIDSKAHIYAIKYGHIGILKLIMKKSSLVISETWFFEAAGYGQINVLHWLGQKFESRYADEQVTCAEAAAKGHLKTLMWLRKNGYAWDYRTCAHAAQNGYLEIVQWAHLNGCAGYYQICPYAALGGQLHIIKWARQNGYKWDFEVLRWAARGGHLDVLKWARQNGCNWNSDVCDQAAENGHLKVLKWARKHGCDWNSDVCDQAAKNGHLKVLKWAHKNGCPWSSSIGHYAAKNGHLKVFKWVVQNGCSGNWNEFLECSKQYPDIQQWLIENKN